MAIKLTEQERMLLEKQKELKEICLQKYMDYANQTNNQQLKRLFNKYALQVQENIETIHQILNGELLDLSEIIDYNQKDDNLDYVQSSIMYCFFDY
ncbi:MAG: hypothetical protein JG764_785 [Clostridiales bacterium]|nr:hypothetical protein [Clostridiales bacterium]